MTVVDPQLKAIVTYYVTVDINNQNVAQHLKVPYHEKHVFSGVYIYKVVLPEPANSQIEENEIPAWSLQPTHW